ncbi:hypothetical protein [Metallibacterium scheffleri]|uniref:PRTRC system protein B n=1 Tax=Metallibacterium scheffleri TaxID=993689 RepID=A0A4S3KMW7_9GAMM|nr:hypothetical protein [Metallibacterium scheffleri]THD10110.1 hypothetical protein B1806_09580 [Metallibacterium scheffleri]
MSASIRPVCALLVHKQRDLGGPTVVTAHPIRAADDSQPPMLDAGRILGRDDVEELICLLRDPDSGTQGRATFFPPNILLASPYRLVWFQPAARSRQYWRRPNEVVHIDAVLPPLVFTATRHGLFVVALGSNDYPREHDAAFHAPLGNVHDHTGVCFGSARIPRTLAPSSTRDWTYVLLGTNYTHVNHGNTLAGGATTDELVAFWKRRERSGSPPSKRFLAPTGMTLGQWIERVSNPDSDRA